jgi:hypothetical protein
MADYNAEKYTQSAANFDKLFNTHSPNISPDMKYNGACVFALNNESSKALALLDDLATNFFYSDYSHITSDSDLNSLHSLAQWNAILEKVQRNRETLPIRRKKLVVTELQKAKDLLSQENGQLWGANLWSDNTLVLDDDNIIYSLQALPNGKTDDGVLYYASIPENTLNHTNTNQPFNGSQWVTVRNDYLDDQSNTIIHELFHLYHKQQINLTGLIVEYLDEADARTWMRLEFEALRNALKKMNDGAPKSAVSAYLNDAMIFRKLREQKYSAYKQAALDLENVEGLANYTGYKLSSQTDKYAKAIRELNEREAGSTLSRSFPYATGVAYGFIFDYLGINWRTDLKHVYDFRSIYERQYLQSTTRIRTADINSSKSRNRFAAINREEQAKKRENDRIAQYYTNALVLQPVLIVKPNLADKTLLMSYDMNSTFALKGRGVVYSDIQASSVNPEQFGKFSMIEGKKGLGASGVLMNKDFSLITFPKPVKIEGNKITGEYYEIELNAGWKVVTLNAKGDIEIVKAKE